MPLPPRRLAPASDTSPAAGNLLVTAEPRELEAVAEAGEVVLARYPYLRARFGERADQFVRGEAAWVVTLSDRRQPWLAGQVDWLAETLLHRGLPRRIPEVFLGVLAPALERRWPERAEAYRRLGAEGERLAGLRRQVLGDDALAAVERRFVERAAGKGPVEPRGTGELVASAVADAALGHPAAVPRLLEWLTTPERFEAAWIQAVEEAAANAREALRS